MTTIDAGYGPYARTPEAIDARERAEAAALKERQANARGSVAPGTRAAADLAERQERERQGVAAKYDAERAALERERARTVERERADVAQRDEALAPVKAERRRAFLLHNPDATDAAFERYWSRIADDEAATLHAQAVERETAAMRASGRFAL